MVFTVVKPGETGLLSPEENFSVGPVVLLVSLEDDGVVVDGEDLRLPPEDSPQQYWTAHRLCFVVTQVVPHSSE